MCSKTQDSNDGTDNRTGKKRKTQSNISQFLAAQSMSPPEHRPHGLESTQSTQATLEGIDEEEEEEGEEAPATTGDSESTPPSDAATATSQQTTSEENATTAGTADSSGFHADDDDDSGDDDGTLAATSGTTVDDQTPTPTEEEEPPTGGTDATPAPPNSGGDDDTNREGTATGPSQPMEESNNPETVLVESSMEEASQEDEDAREALAATTDNAGGTPAATADTPETDSSQEEEEEEFRFYERRTARCRTMGTPVPSTMEAGADYPTYKKTKADKLLLHHCGDYAHDNPGIHLRGGVADDGKFQDLWKKVVSLPQTHYDVAKCKGPVFRRFVTILTNLFKDVRERKINGEKVVIFPCVILSWQHGVNKASEIKRLLKQRMDLWENGKYESLIHRMVEEYQCRVSGGRKEKDEESIARQYNTQVLSGRTRQAVRQATGKAGGGVLQPTETCTKTGKSVMEVLREKHPKMLDPQLTADGDDAVFQPYPNQPEPVPLQITAELVEDVVKQMEGAAVPSGVDAVTLRNWCMRCGRESELLREELARFAEWLSNDSPPWAAYRAFMSCRLIALDKDPGVRPVGIGEVYRRLWAKCAIKVSCSGPALACGNANLCAGLPAGIEAALHAMVEAPEEWAKKEEAAEEAVRVEADAQPLTQEPLPSSQDGDGTSNDNNATTTTTEGSQTQSLLTQPPEPEVNPEPNPNDPTVRLLVDAANGFNNLSRKAMLWEMRFLLPGLFRLALNCYRHQSQLVVRERGKECTIIYSKEGVTQGDPLSMILYGITVCPLARRLLQCMPDLIQTWYADDYALSGPASRMKIAMKLVQKWGPHRGYFPEPDKSVVVCKIEHTTQAKAILEEFEFKYAKGKRYVGGFLGTEAARTDWMEEQIQKWVKNIQTLAKIAKKFPQTAYAGMTKSLQNEWAYLQRVCGNAGELFQPIEDAIAQDFLPALFGCSAEELAESKLRPLLALPVKLAGLGIPDPTKNAQRCHDTSKACTKELVTSLLEGKDLDVRSYIQASGRERRAASKARRKAEDEALAALIEKDFSSALDRRRLERAKEAGIWLSTMPNLLNGTELSAEEFRDSLLLRYGLIPKHLPAKCDGCGNKFDVDHGLTCKVGGKITLRHNEVMSEWHQLCASAFTPSAVSDEPLIPTSQDRNQGEANGNTTTTTVGPAIRGDVACRGFWTRGTTTIFDVRITDTTCGSYRRSHHKVVLDNQEKEKKKKYNDACLQSRRNFTPLVFSVDGAMGTETRAATRRLAALLAGKWKRAYSELCGYVRSRISIALVRATTQCLRGPRDPTARRNPPQWESGTGLALY